MPTCGDFVGPSVKWCMKCAYQSVCRSVCRSVYVRACTWRLCCASVQCFGSIQSNSACLSGPQCGDFLGAHRESYHVTLTVSGQKNVRINLHPRQIKPVNPLESANWFLAVTGFGWLQLGVSPGIIILITCWFLTRRNTGIDSRTGKPIAVQVNRVSMAARRDGSLQGSGCCRLLHLKFITWLALKRTKRRDRNSWLLTSNRACELVYVRIPCCWSVPWNSTCIRENADWL